MEAEKRLLIHIVLFFVGVCSLVGISAVEADVLTYNDRDAFEAAVGESMTTIGFETYPNGDPIPATPDTIGKATVELDGTEFQELGILLSSPIGDTLGVSNASLFGLTNHLCPNFHRNAGQIQVDFSEPVIAVGSDFFDIGTPTSSLAVFDSEYNLIAEFTIPAFGDRKLGFRGVKSDVPIRRALFKLDMELNGRTIDGVSLDNLEFPTILPQVDATVDIDPDTLNLNNRGRWVTCYIELPEGYDVAEIDGSTVALESVPAYLGRQGWAKSEANRSNIMDHDEDDIPERMVKFERSAVQGLIMAGPVTLTVTGKLLDWTHFQGTDTIDVVGAEKNNSPTITSTPPTTATEGELYEYDVEATDPDGHTLTYSLPVAPSGMTIETATGLIEWTPSATQAGNHNVTARVVDGWGGEDEQIFVITVAEAINVDPKIISNPPITGTEGVLYEYDVEAEDQDGDTLTYSLTVSPSGMTIDTSTGLIEWTPSATQAGSHGVTVKVIDGRGGEDDQPFAIVVAEALNNAPEITSTPVTNATEGLPYTYDVDADDLDGDTLEYSLTVSPTGMTIDASKGLIEWTPANYQVGTHNVQVEVSDGRGGSDTQSYQVVVEAAAVSDYIRPSVNVTVAPMVANVGETVTITVAASDDVAVTFLELTVNGVVVALDIMGTATYTSGTAGIFTALATARDAAGNEGSGSEEFRFLAPGDVTPPTVAITSPAEDSKIDGPVDVVGTASDDNIVRYVLEYSPKDKNEYVRFVGGTSSITDDVLGTLDPTMMRNGQYDIKLTAEDQSGNVASITTAYQLEGEMKVGNFTMTFNDLTIPVAGIPITISRTYDSRVKLKGDFGVGWTLGIKDIELSESGVMGDGWQQTFTGGLFGWYIISPTEPHYVTVTFPDGRVDEFDAMIVPDRQQLIPLSFTNMYFTPRTGTLSSLVDATSNNLDLWIIGGVGPVQLLDWFNFEPYDPYRYRLTDKDGTVYVINQPGGLQSITDRNGNTITFNSNGIIHSAGKSVLFARDGQGRITTITDPLGNTIQYQYDSYGDLVAVTDQEDNKTLLKYNSSHGLVDIIDPRGVGVARNIYDDEGRLTAIIDADGNRVDFTHDVDTRQEIVNDRLGNVTVYEYDEDGNVVSKTDALGNKTTYTYDAQGNKLTETDPLSNTMTYTYDAQDNMLTEADPLGNTTTYTYNSNGQVLTITDCLGHTTTNTYDAGGNLTGTTDPLGNTTNYTYDAAGNMLTETDPLGNTTTYTYDAFGNMLTMTDPLGNTTTYTYDNNGNRLTETRTRTTWTGVENMVTQYTYDGMNRLVQTTDPLGNTSVTEYNAIGKESARIDQLGRRTEYQYDARGNLIQVMYPDGTDEAYSYDAENRKVSSTNRGGRITQYEYDKIGNLIKTTFADASITQTEYDEAGRVTRNINQRGNATTYEYDAAGRNTVVVDATGNRTEYTYNCIGNRIGMTDANGNITQYEYDPLNRLIKTTYPNATTVVVAYDAAGRKIAETDQADNTTQYEYDPLGRLIKVTDALGGVTQYAYDEVGNQVTQTDANGNTTSFAYDALGRQTTRWLPLVQTETMTYDAAGNLISKTDFNGNTTTYSYDVCCGRLLRKDFPDGSWIGFTYTPTGRRATEVKSSGETTTYVYDVMDRLSNRADPDGGAISYTYDAAGNRITLTTSAGVTTYNYDALNRLATVTDPDAGVTQYTYDAVGNRATITYPNTTVTQYTYDSLNRLTNLLNRTGGGATISSYAYTLGPAGNRIHVVEDTGRTVDYTYDALYRLIRETITEGADVTTIDYAYDPVGNRLAKAVATAAGTTTTTYVYDNNDRLITETVAVARLTTPQGEIQYASFSRPSAAAPYMRDGFLTISLLGLLVPLAITWVTASHLGRRARRQRSCISALCVFLIPMFVLGADSVLAINHQANLYTVMSAAGVTQLPDPVYTYTYDNNGNTISRTDGTDTDSYTYDYENRLTSANIQLGTTPGPVSYTYDADGIRGSKMAGGTTTSFLVDKNRPFAQVLVETTGATTASYVHGDDLISMKRPTGTSYYLYDGQMSTRQLTNPAQTVTDSYTYDAFGIELDRTGTTVNNYKYTGEQYDPNVGFYYLRARYYNQETSRFVTTDPFPGRIFDPISLHRYLYAHANPVMNLDPSGHLTLIGQMTVITVIGILASLVYFSVFNFLSRASTPVKWSGIIMILTHGNMVGGGGLLIELESECHFGKKGVGKYVVAMVGLTFSWSVLGFPSFSVTSITLETPGMFGPNPWVLAGLATFISLAFVVGPVGWSWGGAVFMGMGRGKFSLKGDYAFGFTDIGLDIMVGIAAPIYAPRPRSCS